MQTSYDVIVTSVEYVLKVTDRVITVCGKCFESHPSPLARARHYVDNVSVQRRTQRSIAQTKMADDSERRITVLYGSQTGTAEEVAERIGRDGKLRHLSVRVMALDDYNIVSLLIQKHIT